MAKTTTADQDKKRKVDEELEKEKVKNIKEAHGVIDAKIVTKVVEKTDLKDSKTGTESAIDVKVKSTLQTSPSASFKGSPELKKSTPIAPKTETAKPLADSKTKETPKDVGDNKTIQTKATPKESAAEIKTSKVTPLESKSTKSDQITPETTVKLDETKKPEEGFWAKYTRENQMAKSSPAVPFAETIAPKSPVKSAFTPVKSDFWAKYSKDSSTSAFSSPTKPKVDFKTLLKQSSETLDTPKSETKSIESKDEAKTNWKELETVTGEEDEDTMAVFRCRLYVSVDGEWKEKGVGNLKINALDNGHRFVMRSDAVLKVILNVRIFKGMPMQQRDKYLEFAAVEDGKLTKFLAQFRTVGKCEEALATIKQYLDK